MKMLFWFPRMIISNVIHLFRLFLSRKSVAVEEEEEEVALSKILLFEV